MRAKDDWTLEVTLEGPRGYFPVLAAYLAALPAHRASVEKFGDKWTEAGNIVCNGPFTLEAWEHNKQIVLRKNPHYFGAKDVHLDAGHDPDRPGASGALPYENNELDITALQTGDLKRLQSRPAERQGGVPLSVPRHLVPAAPGDQAAVRQPQGPAGGGATPSIARTWCKVSQGFAIPAWSMIPPGFPGAVDDARIKAIQRYDKKAGPRRPRRACP